MPQTRYHSLIYITLLAIAWGGAVLFVLSFKDIQGDWDHAACGVWGCSPPLAAVGVCQAIWGLILFPVILWVNRVYPQRIARITANTFVGVGLLASLVIVIYEIFHWLLFVQPEHRIYFGHRIALATLTQVEFPVVMLLISGLVLRVASAIKSSPTPPAGHLKHPAGQARTIIRTDPET
ncbi:hypothetical protein [Thalassoglobus polymorphus]|uniref:Uncharacterized protein n=1 Tax=Thalassoglobus polymorphus TaxID=2527994 RepID=A0A517QSR6_9PLAN|nr:hypothetical protein [Thalassoglobus polymorphus]QDT34676.1 hypothetical protein Mal48_39440 [Thalassoglobus polymorphus]